MSIETVIVRGIQTAAIISFDKAPRGTTPIPKEILSRTKMAMWGDDNALPQNIITDIRKDHELGQIISDKAQLLYSGGLTWGIPKIDDKGNEVLLPISDEENDVIAEFCEYSNIPKYLMEASMDLEMFYNAFVEMILQRDRKKITQICTQAAENCRFSLMNKSGIIENCYINANYPDADENSKETITLPVIDPYYKPAESLKKITKGTNFILPISFPTPGCTYYQHPFWNGLREGDWLPLSQAIPKSKLKILEKQLNIKYHIEISDQYWELKYPGFSTKKPEEKSKLVDAELKAFTDVLTGVEKAGNSLITVMKTDFNLNKEYSLWKITAIDSKIGKGEFIEEMKEASLAKMAAVGLHPALSGTMPNSGMGGAGSNIREAYNLNNIKNMSKQDMLLSPLYVVKRYNEWNPKVVFRIRNPFMTTLDKGTETTNNPK